MRYASFGMKFQRNAHTTLISAEGKEIQKRNFFGFRPGLRKEPGNKGEKSGGKMDAFHGRDQKIKGNLKKELEKNIEILGELLKDCDDVVKREFYFGGKKKRKACLFFVDGMAEKEVIEETVIRPMMRKSIWDDGTMESRDGRIDTEEPERMSKEKEEDNRDVFDEREESERTSNRKTGNSEQIVGQFLFQYVVTEILEMSDLKEASSLEDAVTKILTGNTLLLLDGCEKGIVIANNSAPTRGVQEADQEVAIRGPKDSFTEVMRCNTVLIRRRIKDSRLKVKQMAVGERSKTYVEMMYMEDLVRPEVLKEIQGRLEQVSMDGILDSGMLEELLTEDWRTPFPCFQCTQRPDKTASALLEGRIALVVDNSPDVLLLPASFHVFFQASDDYYNQWQSASFARMLRYIAAFLAVGLPAFYVAVANFHTEVLPTALILSIAQARMGIPFPVVVEVLLMEVAFELLREAGIRLPGQLGGTIGIVGGLIVGQAAVDAGIVSTIVVIVVSLTAIASFAVPNETMRGTFRVLKFAFLFLAAVWGIYGFFLGWLFIIVHLSTLESFGQPYLRTDLWISEEKREKYKDYFWRLPLFTMKKRPVFTKKGARIRRKIEGKFVKGRKSREGDGRR